MNLGRWLLAGVAFLPYHSQAQEPEEEDLTWAYGSKEFVSIATGTKQLISKAPSVATVITAEDIAAMGARTIEDALVTVPGLHVSRSTFNYASTYAMRGVLTEYNPHVLTMVNGIPITSVYLNNRNDLPIQLPVDNVLRIEIIRGPGSAVYGADAFSGTINIITKPASDIKSSSFSARTGSNSSHDLAFENSGKIKEIKTYSFIKIGTTNGQNNNIQRDALGQSGQIRLPHDDIDASFAAEVDRIKLRASYTSREKAALGIGAANVLDPSGEFRSQKLSTDLSWSDANITQYFGLTAQAAYMQLANEITRPLQLFPAGAIPGFPNGVLGQPNKWEKQLRISLTGNYTGFENHKLRFGFGYENLNLYKVTENKNFVITPGPIITPLPGGMTDVTATAPYLRPRNREVSYTFIQDEYSLARDWTLTGGLRYDKYSDFGGTTNPRLALVWEARQDLTAKLMYGSAFRAPSFVEQSAINNPTAIGNPGIKPETIRTLEAAVSWEASQNIRVNFNVFKHRISDIIRFVASGGINTARNTGSQEGSGAESEITWTVHDGLKFSGHYAYQRNVDETTGHDSGYAPHHRLYGRADWRLAPGYQLTTQFNHVADRNRAFGDNRAQIGDYSTVDLTLRTDRPKQGWDFSASVYNLFNADAREPSLIGSGIVYDLPLPKRTFWLQARYSL